MRNLIEKDFSQRLANKHYLKFLMSFSFSCIFSSSICWYLHEIIAKEMHFVIRVLCAEFEMTKCESCGTFVHLDVDLYLDINSILIWHHRHHIETLEIEHIAHGNQRKWKRVIIIKCWEMFCFRFCFCPCKKGFKLPLQNEIHSSGVYLTSFPIAHCVWYIYYHFKGHCGSVTNSMMMRLKMPQPFHYYGPFVF